MASPRRQCPVGPFKRVPTEEDKEEDIDGVPLTPEELASLELEAPMKWVLTAKISGLWLNIGLDMLRPSSCMLRIGHGP